MSYLLLLELKHCLENTQTHFQVLSHYLGVNASLGFSFAIARCEFPSIGANLHDTELYKITIYYIYYMYNCYCDTK